MCPYLILICNNNPTELRIPALITEFDTEIWWFIEFLFIFRITYQENMNNYEAQRTVSFEGRRRNTKNIILYQMQ